MTASFTPNVQLTEPARGDNVGTWDTPVNANTTALDLMLGGIATISVNNSNIVLNSAQFQCRNLTFNSTLTGNITVTLAASFVKNYEVQNLATGSSAFTITLETTAGGQVICAPPGQTVDIFNDGINIKFKNLPPVGSLMDFAVSTVPLWVQGCSVPPWLNCTGATFLSSVYPALASFLGGTTLPDYRGTVPAVLDQSAGRLTAGSSIGLTGSQSVTLGTSQIPSHTHGVSDPGHVHNYNAPNANTTTGGGGFLCGGSVTNNLTTTGSFTGITITNTGGGAPVATVQPTAVFGLRMIRAG
jgi:microcystin-dependent protein